MKGNRASLLSFAKRCKNILASNWVGQLNTIQADSKGSKEKVFSSKVKYMLKKGRPYIWVPEKELHNVNTIIDERGSLSVASPYPGPLASVLKSIKKCPARAALIGDLLPLKDARVKSAAEKLKEIIQSEEEMIRSSSYAVSGLLSSSNFLSTSRAENLRELLQRTENYVVYKFSVRSCMYVDGNGGTHELDLEDMESSRADLLAPFSARVIDGVNQSESRRRALMLFCFVRLNVRVKDALLLSIDCKGFDVLGMVPSAVLPDGSRGYTWKEYRFTFKEEALDIESFCRQLVEMEEEAVKKVSSYSGLA